LPMLPETIPLKVLKNTKAQFECVKKLMNSAEVDRIVCATDSGREGELIFRYIYQMAKCNKPVMRLWISSMTDASIKAGLTGMKPSEAYDALYLSAKCRSEADWLVGMNASRAFSLRYNAHLSLGRVQTPTLALLVKRGEEIEKFVPEDYFELIADFGDYKGTWIDESQKTRIDTQEKAKQLEAFVKGKEGVLCESTREEKRRPPERLYDLTTLQREANRKYGYSADKTLNLAQSLYEKHKLITYPRTDSRFLTNDMVSKVESTIKKLPEPYAAYVKKILPVVKAERIYNESKVSDHHAIIPTDKTANLSSLSQDERNVYDMITRRFVSCHYPDYVYLSAKIITDVDGQKFKSTGNVTISEGWRELYQDERKEDEENSLPDVKKGDRRKVLKTRIKAQKTKPPKPYSDDTLLKAMEDAGKTIDDEDLRDEMKDSGLGTPATRAAIITRLIQVGYAKRSAKKIEATEKGRMLISVVPEEMKSAVTTGKWERALSKMAKISSNDEMTVKEKKFMDSIRRFSTYLVDYAKSQSPAMRFPEEAKPKRKTAGKTSKKTGAI